MRVIIISYNIPEYLYIDSHFIRFFVLSFNEYRYLNVGFFILRLKGYSNSILIAYYGADNQLILFQTDYISDKYNIILTAE